jgi:hypothetical protein
MLFRRSQERIAVDKNAVVKSAGVKWEPMKGYPQMDHHTMDTYVQAVTDEKREAQNKLVKMILPGIQRAVI